jgi:hypothetical protein
LFPPLRYERTGDRPQLGSHDRIQLRCTVRHAYDVATTRPELDREAAFILVRLIQPGQSNWPLPLFIAFHHLPKRFHALQCHFRQ